MKISEITILDIKNYLNVYHAEDDILITAILTAAKAFVSSYTGLAAESLDLREDLSMAVYILASELYDNRAYNVDNSNVNPVIKAILNMHSINLL
jgi:N12 class adenine-specific DNA methylase